MTRPIIGLSGIAGAGKSHIASRLLDRGFAIVSFATPIKAIATKCFGWNGEKDAAGRRLLQGIADAGMAYDPDMWVKRWAESLFHMDESAHRRGLALYPIVADDVRFPNQADHIREQGGRIVRIVPSPAPRPRWVNEHPSETALDDYRFDAVLTNRFDAQSEAAIVAAILDMAGR